MLFQPELIVTVAHTNVTVVGRRQVKVMKITNSRVGVPTLSWFAVVLPRNKAPIRSLLNIDKLRKAFSIGSYHVYIGH
jgi:hypothetical protein